MPAALLCYRSTVRAEHAAPYVLTLILLLENPKFKKSFCAYRAADITGVVFPLLEPLYGHHALDLLSEHGPAGLPVVCSMALLPSTAFVRLLPTVRDPPLRGRSIAMVSKSPNGLWCASSCLAVQCRRTSRYHRAVAVKYRHGFPKSPNGLWCASSCLAVMYRRTSRYHFAVAVKYRHGFQHPPMVMVSKIPPMVMVCGVHLHAFIPVAILCPSVKAGCRLAIFHIFGGMATQLVITCQRKCGLTPLFSGLYELSGTHGGKPCYRKACAQSPGGHVHAYHRSFSPWLTGWWLGPFLGGQEVWPFCAGEDAEPPEYGWRCPY